MPLSVVWLGNCGDAVCCCKEGSPGVCGGFGEALPPILRAASRQGFCLPSLDLYLPKYPVLSTPVPPLQHACVAIFVD